MLTQKLFASLSFTPVCGSHNGTFQQGSNCLTVMTDGNLAQSISCLIVSSLLVFQSELKGGQGTYPSVPSGIEVWGGKDVHQQIVVRSYHEWHVHKVLFEVFSDTPLEGKKLKFRAEIIFL